MKIGVIGTGNMGAGLAALFSGKHDVFIGHRDPAKAAELARKLGPSVQGGGIAAAISVADIVVLATPFGAVSDIISAAGDLNGKVLVDISNPVSADFSELVIGHETSAAEEIQKLALGANVVKAFNTLFAQLLPEELRQSNKLQVFIAGDNERAREQVAELATSVNLEPVNAGPLKNSRYLEPLGAMNIQFGYFLGQGPVVAPAWVKA